MRRRLVAGLEKLEGRQLLAGDVTLFADSFESGSDSNDWAGNWVEDSQNDWFRSTQRATDGSRSAEVDGYAGNATLAMSNALDLSGYESAELSFDWLIESGFDSGEYLALDVSSDDGASWNTGVLQLDGNSDPENEWRSETVDLTPFASSEVLVRFRSQVSSSNEDANVDNVRITGVEAGNQAPAANAGEDQTLSDAGGNGDEFVTLTGIGSDSDGTIASYEWSEGTTVLGTTATISPTLTAGTHTLTLVVTDNVGATATDTVVITINDVQEKPIKVFLLAGQSNLTGTARVENLDPAWNVPQDDVWIWLDHDMDGGQWTTSGPGHGLSTHAPRPEEPEGLDPRNGLGPELSLGRILADAYPDHRVALIKHGDGGRDLASHFNPANIGPPESNEHMWSGLLKKTDDAFAVLDAAGYTYDVEGFFLAIGGGDARNRNSNSSDPDEVLAGEQEALARSAQYGVNLTNFIGAVRAEYAENLPFIMTRIADEVSPELLETYPGADLVRQGQLDVAASDPWTDAFSPGISSLRDAVHYDAAGQIEFGTKLGDRYFDLVSPIADDDSFSVNEDGVLTVAAPGVLDGDTDPEGDPLTAVLATQATNGVVVLNPDGSFDYTPNPDFNGSDSFTYMANDGTSNSNIATVMIDVVNVNDAPVASPDSYSVEQDTPLNVAAAGMLSNDTDADGDTLNVVQHTDPDNGALVVNADGSFSYTPNPGFVGTDSFTYQVNDGTVNGNIATVTLEVNAVSTDEALYVYDIRFDSKKGNRDWRATFEVRDDANNPIAGVAITVTFAGNTYVGTTNSSGTFTTPWLKNIGSGSHFAEVTDLVLADYNWNQGLGASGDDDGDGLPDAWS